MKTTTYFLTALTTLAISLQIGCREGGDAQSCKDSSSNGCHAFISELEAPKQIKAATLSKDKVKLTWVPSTFNEDYFIKLEYKEELQNDYQPLEVFTKDKAASEISNLKSDTKYFFRFQSFIGSRYSAYSSEVEAITAKDTVILTNPAPTLTIAHHASIPGAVQIDIAYSNTNTSLIQNVTYARTVGATSTPICTTSCPISGFVDTAAPAGPVAYSATVTYADATVVNTPVSSSIIAKLEAPSNLTNISVNWGFVPQPMHKLTWANNTASPDHNGFELEATLYAGTSIVGQESTSISPASTTVFYTVPSACAAGLSVEYKIKATSGNPSVLGSSQVGNLTTIACPTPATTAPALPVPTLTAIHHPTLPGVIRLVVTYSNSNTNLIDYVTFLRVGNGSMSTFTCSASTIFGCDYLAPPAGVFSYKVTVNYTAASGGSITSTVPTAQIAGSLSIPTNLTATLISIPTDKFQIGWVYGTSPIEHSGYEISWFMPSTSTSGTVQISGAGTMSYQLTPPAGCNNGQAIQFKIKAKSSNSLVLSSNDSATINTICPSTVIASGGGGGGNS